MSLVSKKYSEKEIIRDISDYVLKKNLDYGTPLETTRELAERYNVSEITINRAVKKLVAKGVLYRKQGSGTFVGKRRFIDRNIKIAFFTWRQVISPEAIKAAYGTFEDILLTELRDAGMNVDYILKDPPHAKVFDGEYLEKYDALVIAGGMVNEQTVNRLKKLNVPVITVFNEELSPYPFHQVFHDYLPAFMHAADVLAKSGVKTVYCGAYDCDTSAMRAGILADCLQKAEINFEMLPKVTLDEERYPFLKAGHELGEYIIKQKLDGVVFTVSDFLGFAIAEAVQVHQLVLGRDVKLISYDNLESRGLCPLGEPVLTSITHPLKVLGEEVVKLAIHVINNQSTGMSQSSGVNYVVRVPVQELVIRKSFMPL